jgi:hypothetical protein
MNELEIIEVDCGIANNFGTHIEINKNLKKYPKLYNAILDHEVEHTDKLFSAKDFKLDLLSSSNINNIDLLWFIKKHPKAIIQFMPLWYSKRNGIYYDINMIIAYTAFSIPIIGGIILGIKFL